MATVIKTEPGPQTRERGDLRPPLKWAGGKRWLVPHLLEIYSAHTNRRLVEPFCGGLAIALGLVPERALLNDINPHAINFYKWLRKGLHRTIEMNNDAESYYACRTRFNDLMHAGQADTAEAAELFYYLNRTGYNGLCRFNRRGEFNVPFGKYKNLNYPTDIQYKKYSRMFKGWDFTASDFATVSLNKDDFVYADPPYDVDFTQYAKEGFYWEDQVRLAEWLAAHPGPVVLSNQATPRIIKLYKELDFQLTYVDAPRMISCTGDRTRAQEVVAVRGTDAFRKGKKK